MKSEQEREARTLSYWSKSSTTSTVQWEHGGDFEYEVLAEREGLLVFRASGKDVKKAFRREAGGHRWQRVSPTEKRGRRHTSTVTVAVLPEPKRHEVKVNESDLEWKFSRGSGAGGQHRNKTDSAVALKHIPTGLVVKCENDRSQHVNKESALSVLRARLWERQRSQSASNREAIRRCQVGSGMRGDKVRTVSVINNVVHDHVANKKIAYKKYVKGFLEELTG